MHPRIATTLALALVAGCGGGAPLATTISAPSPVPAPDAFSCLRNQLKTIGFSQQSYDQDELRLTARKIDEDTRRPDTQFRRMIDRIEFDVEPGTGGNITEIIGEASTFAEYSTERGPTEEQQKASETATNAVKTLIDKCKAPVDSIPTPG
jgi:hypothetical protein